VPEPFPTTTSTNAPTPSPGANPIPIIVPCHRVLGSNGRITGYSGGEGVPTKAWLLAHEGITHRLPATPTADISLTLDLPEADESDAA
jgi:methylated-DNA-[protein]-cysteine S-methyltransferase